MSRHIDKEALVAAVMSSTELDNEQKSQLIRLIREQKKYGFRKSSTAICARETVSVCATGA